MKFANLLFSASTYSSVLLSTCLFCELVVASSRAVSIPFTRERRPGIDISPRASRERLLRKRKFKNIRRNVGKTALEVLDNEEFLFYANVTIGTPPQDLRLHIDTGSSDIWVEYSKSSICTQPYNPCEDSGTYDNTTSSTYKYINSDFTIKYVDQTYAQGDYAAETFHIGGIAVTDLQFGMGIDTSSQEGIMGIGFETIEAQVAQGGEPYPNLVYQMQKQNKINSVAYSLWLNDLDASTGQILFGGIDTEKFMGQLATLPIDKTAGSSIATEFIITLTGISLTNSAAENRTVVNGSSAGIPVLLDSGTSFTYLPTEVAEALSDSIGAEYDSDIGGPILPCSRSSIKGSINFVFSGITIRVPLDEFIVEALTSDGEAYYDNDGNQVCLFGILPVGSSSSSTLGDTFLRSAYVVYDLSNEQISLAQTNFNATLSNILEIQAGANGIPNANGISSALTLRATATKAAGGVATESFTTSGGSLYISSTATMTTSSRASSTSTKSAAFSIHTDLSSRCTWVRLFLSWLAFYFVLH